MTLAVLRASLALWQRRERAAKARHAAAVKRGDEKALEQHSERLHESRRMVARRTDQIRALEGAGKPPIVTAAQLGLQFKNLFGALGPETNVTGHYSAGARARNAAEGRARALSFHRDHTVGPRLRAGGCAYHYLISDDGTLFCLRPTALKGAHVGGHNSNNIGVNMPGTTGDRPTAAQVATYKWLLSNAHTSAMPKAHRTDRSLRSARRHGHNSWSGHQSNGCPGLFKSMYITG